MRRGPNSPPSRGWRDDMRRGPISPPSVEVSFAGVRKRLRSAPLSGCTPSAARGCSPRPARGAPAPRLWARGAPAPPCLPAPLSLRPGRGRPGYGRAVVGGYAPSFSFGWRGAFSRCRGVSIGSPASPTRGSLRLSSSRAPDRHSRPTSREREKVSLAARQSKQAFLPPRFARRLRDAPLFGGNAPEPPKGFRGRGLGAPLRGWRGVITRFAFRWGFAPRTPQTKRKGLAPLSLIIEIECLYSHSPIFSLVASHY